MKISILEIIFVTFLLASPIIGAYFGICTLKLRKKNEQLRQDRNNLIESRSGWELEMIRKNPELSDTDKKLIFVALNLPFFTKEVNAQGLDETYEHLKKKIKDSINT